MKLFHSLLVALQLLVNPTNAVYSKDVLDMHRMVVSHLVLVQVLVVLGCVIIVVQN